MLNCFFLPRPRYIGTGYCFRSISLFLCSFISLFISLFLCQQDYEKTVGPICRLVVLESGLGLESGLKSIFAGLGLGLGLESYGLGLGLGLEGSTIKSFFQVRCTSKL